MNLRPSIILTLLIALLGIPVMVSAQRLNSARSKLQTTQESLAQTTSDSQRIVELRAKQQTIAEQKKPDQDIIARINAVLAECGIPTGRFEGLRPESDAALPTTGQSPALYRRQSVRVALNELTVPQIGEFLSRWSASQPMWVATRIELTHVRGNDNDEGRYNLNVLLSATYVGHEVPS